MNCVECGKAEYMLFKCHYCGFHYCDEHRLPESHNCPNFRHILHKHEQAWKYGKATVKFKSEYNNTWDNNVREINKVKQSKARYDNIVTNPCPNCGIQFKQGKYSCVMCGKYFCSIDCANPHTHGCKVESISFKNKSNSSKNTTYIKKTIKNLPELILLGILIICLALFFLFVPKPSSIDVFDGNIDANILSVLYDNNFNVGLSINYNLKSNVQTVYLLSGNGDKLYDLDCMTKGVCNNRFWISPKVQLKKISSDENYTSYSIGKLELMLCADYNKQLNQKDCQKIITTNEGIVKLKNCSDKTEPNTCSVSKPLFCKNGILVNDADSCGCLAGDYRKVGKDCVKIQRCSDRTEYGNCSSTKPLYCLDGNLINKATTCGCPSDLVEDGEKCVSKYRVGPKTSTFTYVLRGKSWKFEMTTYKGLNDYLANLSRTYTCYNNICPSDEEIELKAIKEPQQKTELDSIVEMINSLDLVDDDKARVAVSIVQQIPYDFTSLNLGNLNGRYPYEVIYDGTGVCGEKSKLLAYLLKGLGYGVVLFEFDKENHMAVGISCPQEYSYINSGYCFIESTNPSIITDSDGDYIGAGKLTSTPTIFEVSEGKSMDSVSEEYKDAQEYAKITDMGTVLSQYWYSKWQNITQKYGFKFN